MTAAETQRVALAMQLARDVDTCASLIAGEPVDTRSLDREQLAWISELDFVTLRPALELFKTFLAGPPAPSRVAEQRRTA